MDENLNLQGNLEIEKALKELEEKSKVEQTQKVVETSKTSDVPKMVQLVMKWSGAKEQKQAEYVLLGFIVVAIGISLFLVFGGSSSSSSNNKLPIYQEYLTPELRATLPPDVLKTIPYKNAK